MKKNSRKHITRLLAVILICAFLASQFSFVSAAIPYQPQAVNEGLSAQSVAKNDYNNAAQLNETDIHQLIEGEDYAPGELIVEVVSQPTARSASISSLEQAYDMQIERVLSTDNFEVNPEDTLSGLSNTEQLDGQDLVKTMYFMSTDRDVIELCDELNTLDNIYNAQPNYKYTIAESTSDTPSPYSSIITNSLEYTEAYTEPGEYTSSSAFKSNMKWWFDYYNVDAAWQYTAGYQGQGVTVAVIDTGCNTAHEDIKDNLWSLSSNTNVCGYYAYGSENILKGSNEDKNSHGSHCCGSIAMAANGTGYVGTAPQCDLMVLQADRRTGVGSFYDSELITSLKKAQSWGADIISMSLGGYNYSLSTYQTYQTVSTDCLIVCAAGNDHFDTTQKVHFPSAASCVMGVMACNNNSNKDKLASFSNYDTTGNFYKVSGPGTSIYSISNTSNTAYTSKNGTSMATPIVAGMIASYMSYMRSKGISWTPAQYQWVIENTINASGNTLQCTALSKSNHSVAYEKGSKFKQFDLLYLCKNGTSLPSSATTAVTFSNSDVKTAVTNATGLSTFTKADINRVSLLSFASTTKRKSLSSYSDFSKLTGLNYLDLSGAKGVTQSNLSTVLNYMPATITNLILTPSTALTSISCLSNTKFGCLSYLDISANNLTDISALKRFTSIVTLYINDNTSIEDISCVSGMSNLYTFNCYGNKISDATPVSALKNLTVCRFGNSSTKKGNYLTTLDPFLKYPGTTLALDYNYINSANEPLFNTNIEAIRTYMQSQNTDSTITLTYSNQYDGTPSSMTDYTVSTSVTVDRATFVKNGLSSIASFTPKPSTAVLNKYLIWDSDNYSQYITSSSGETATNALNITSTRKLKFKCKAPDVTGITKTYTVNVTVTAPELYSCYTDSNNYVTGSEIKIIAVTNLYTTSLKLYNGTTAVATFTESDATVTQKQKCKVWLIKTSDSSIVSTTGTKALYLFPGDSAGYSVTSSVTSKVTDTSGISSYSFKKLSCTILASGAATADTIHTRATPTICRDGEVACFGPYYDTSEVSPGGTFGTTMGSTYSGGGTYYTAIGLGFSAGAQNVNVGSDTVKVTNELVTTGNSTTVTTAAPVIKTNYTVLNADTAASDGYIEYELRTNMDATKIKAVNVNTGKTVCTSDELFGACQNSYTTFYADTSSNYKAFHIQVALVNGVAQQIKFVAADSLGDGSNEIIPAATVGFNSDEICLYANSPSLTYSSSDNAVILPAGANVGKSLTYSQSSSSYFSTTSAGKATFNQSAFSKTSKSTYATITAKLPNGQSASYKITYYNPHVSGSLTYDSSTSQIYIGGTVYYTVTTYGADYIKVKDTTSSTAEPLATYTTENTDNYTDSTDEKGNPCRIWTFTREITESGTFRTYVYPCTDINAETYGYSYASSSISVGDANAGNYDDWYAQIGRIPDDTSVYDADEVKAVEDIIASLPTNLSSDSQDLIDSKTAQLSNAIDIMLGLCAADFTAYSNAVRQAQEAIDSGLYYDTSGLQELLAIDISGTLKKDQKSVDDLTAQILNEIANLERFADTSEWEAALASIPTYLNKVFSEDDKYYIFTPEIRELVKNSAKLPIELPAPESMQDIIDEQTTNLRALINQLNTDYSQRIDVTVLKNKIDEKEKYDIIAANYTLPDGMYERYVNAVNAANEKLVNLTSDDEVTVYTLQIQEAAEEIDNFVREVDALNDYLTFLYENVPGLESGINSVYSEESFAALLRDVETARTAQLDSAQTAKSLRETLTADYESLHIHALTANVLSTKCTGEYTVYTCHCGYIVYDISGAAGTHTFSEWEIVNENSTQYSKRTCTHCGYTEYEQLDESLFTWEEDYTIDVAPTCSHGGTKSIHAVGYSATKDTVFIPPTAHSFTKWYTVESAKVGVEGKAACECTECSAKVYRTIPALSSGYRLSGKFTSFNETLKTEINAYDAASYTEFSSPVASITLSGGTLSSSNAYTNSFELYLENGTYVLTISKPGHLKCTIYNIKIQDKSLDLSSKNVTANLVPGDFNDDSVINALDKIEISKYIGNSLSSASKYDFNGDGTIGLEDLHLVKLNYMTADNSITLTYDSTDEDSNDNDNEDPF